MCVYVLSVQVEVFTVYDYDKCVLMVGEYLFLAQCVYFMCAE